MSRICVAIANGHSLSRNSRQLVCAHSPSLQLLKESTSSAPMCEPSQEWKQMGEHSGEIVPTPTMKRNGAQSCSTVSQISRCTFPSPAAPEQTILVSGTMLARFQIDIAIALEEGGGGAK